MTSALDGDLINCIHCSVWLSLSGEAAMVVVRLHDLHCGSSKMVVIQRQVWLKGGRGPSNAVNWVDVEETLLVPLGHDVIDLDTST